MVNRDPNSSFATKYSLKCSYCGATYEPDPFRLNCSNNHAAALLRVHYRNSKFTLKSELSGIFQYIDWLPVNQALLSPGKPVTYKSQKLAHHLGLKNLYISFNGYWPEKNASLFSCSFKELEAITVIAQLSAKSEQTLVVSSAGNTGRAFAVMGSSHLLPICIVTPQDSLSSYWSNVPFGQNISLVTLENADYSDAIQLGNHISQLQGFFPEGGVRNVARRAGMGLTVIDAAVTLGKIPDHYFQAVGSGTGGIAAWEASLLLLQDGNFGSNPLKLHLSQNAPFTPLVEAWRYRDRCIPDVSDSEARRRIDQVIASVLTNRTPAYSIHGGLYDALKDTQGEMYSVQNLEAENARRLFEQLEGIDISPAAGVATASLMQAVNMGTVQKHEDILLNITSGGRSRLRQDVELYAIEPTLTFKRSEISFEQVKSRIIKKFQPTISV